MTLAVKIYHKIKLIDQPRKNSVFREIQILKKTDHINIVKLHEIIEGPKSVKNLFTKINLIMELVEGISLLNYIKSKPNKRIEENECKEIFSQIIKGIYYCHENNIYHRDIKLENLIIDETKRVKIIDFGFGTNNPKTKLLNFYCGTPSYMPPEIVQKKEYLGI